MPRITVQPKAPFCQKGAGGLNFDCRPQDIIIRLFSLRCVVFSNHSHDLDRIIEIACGALILLNLPCPSFKQKRARCRKLIS